MNKAVSLIKTSKTKQLEMLLTDKQRIFVNKLREEGATFELVPKGTYVHIKVISRVLQYYRHDDLDPDVIDSDLTFDETQDMGFWGL